MSDPDASPARAGEFERIAQIQALLDADGARTHGVVVGPGDDCAVFSVQAGGHLAVTCDSMVAGRHYLPEYSTPFELGRRAMVMNISDLGAMGAHPLYALVSLGLKGEFGAGEVAEMYRGFLAELNPFGASVIGGNLTRVEREPFIDVTLIGRVEPGGAVLRSTARPGDAILLVGTPGRAAAGLRLLLACGPTTEEWAGELIGAYTSPSHRAREGRAAALTGLLSSMIDQSDGLLGDLGHICDESGVGARVFTHTLPVGEQVRRAASFLGVDPLSLVTGASDDYGLILTCPPSSVGEVRGAVARVSDSPVHTIGAVTGDHGVIELVHPDGASARAERAGWDHFSTRRR